MSVYFAQTQAAQLHQCVGKMSLLRAFLQGKAACFALLLAGIQAGVSALAMACLPPAAVCEVISVFATCRVWEDWNNHLVTATRTLQS